MAYGIWDHYKESPVAYGITVWALARAPEVARRKHVSGEPSGVERRRGRGFHLNPQTETNPRKLGRSRGAAPSSPLLSSPLPTRRRRRETAMALHAPVLVMSMRFPPPPCAPPFLCLVFRLRDGVSLLLLGFSLGFFLRLFVSIPA